MSYAFTIYTLTGYYLKLGDRKSYPGKTFIAFMVLKKHYWVMPKIRVKLFANFREYAGTKELELEGDTVAEILGILCEKVPALEKMIFKGKELQPYINIFLNGRDILNSGGIGTVLHQNDEIAIFPPVSGG